MAATRPFAPVSNGLNLFAQKIGMSFNPLKTNNSKALKYDFDVTLCSIVYKHSRKSVRNRGCAKDFTSQQQKSRNRQNIAGRVVAMLRDELIPSREVPG